MKVVLADNEDLLLEGLKAVISGEKGAQSVIVRNKDELFGGALTNADVVFFNPFADTAFDISDLKKINTQYPKTKIIVITTPTDRESVQKVTQFDIQGYVLKCCRKEEIINALQTVMAEEKFFCGKVLNTVLGKNFGKKNSKNLTRRETEIIKFIYRGMTTAQIASHLHRSVHTVNTHRKNILKKLNLRNASDLVRFAVENKLDHY